MVAAEVKSFAVQTAKAAEEVAGQLVAVQESTAVAVAAIGRIAERMQEINEDTSSVTESVRQQDVATGEIAHNVWSAAEGTKAIASMLSDVSGAASGGITEVEIATIIGTACAMCDPYWSARPARDPAPAGSAIRKLEKRTRALNQMPNWAKGVGQAWTVQANFYIEVGMHFHHYCKSVVGWCRCKI